LSIALVLGGAACVHEDIAAAQALWQYDIIVAVKDIGITWPHVDYWVTYHPERLPKELAQRRAAGLHDPGQIWAYKVPIKSGIDLPIKALSTSRGGSSGLLGTEVALLFAAKAVLCGIPLDPKQPHYRRPRKGGWPPGNVYRLAWKEVYPKLKGRVRSMSGWTQELLGAPTEEWLREDAADPPPSKTKRARGR
jgi:hypothetical protein